MGMNTKLLITLVIDPVLEALPFAEVKERALLLTAIAIQESGLRYRRQQPAGPASSYWQIEPGAAIDTLKRCKPVRELWSNLGLPKPSYHHTAASILEYSDLGACAVAAGILRLTSGSLPRIGDQAAAWAYYLDAWRPAEKSRKSGAKRWAKSCATALAACRNETQ